MATHNRYISRMIKYQGTTQKQRNNPALDPSSVELMDYDVKQWMQFAYDFAKNVNYFGPEDEKNPVDNWTNFFPKEAEIEALLKEESLSGTVEPHLALFVCFLKLLELSRSRFNNLTKRHLDFYYKEVLMLSKKEASPDKVNVLFELAKRAVQTKIEKGAYLDAGKDEEGKKVIFETQEDIIVNHAKVVALKNVYRQGDKLFYSDNAATKDGQEEELDNENEGFWAFGHSEKIEEQALLQSPEIGIAIASPILAMNDGHRVIVISSNTLNVNPNTLSCLITGSEEWMELESISKPELDIMLDASLKFDRYFNYFFYLKKEQEAILNYNADIHKLGIIADSPVLKITNKQGLSFDLQNVFLAVLASEVENLYGWNDYGKLNLSNAVSPFGLLPKKHSSFSISHNEISKNKDNLLFWHINLAWKAYPQYTTSKNISQDGFISYSLNEDLNYYPTTKITEIGTSQQTIEVLKAADESPTLLSAKLGYRTRSFNLFQDDSFELFHIHPFGVEPIQKTENNLNSSIPEMTGGNLFIGLENANAGDAISLLIQVKEGSETIEPGSEVLIRWKILTDHGWTSIDQLVLSDNTRGFKKSGIVKIAIPKEASLKHNIMASGFHWIKVQLTGAFNSVCKVIRIEAQAIQAQRLINADVETYIQTPENTISKLVNRTANVKTIQQPFSSFDGRQKETDLNFYKRVSERLRHKNRALTVWDYERLLLEKFPSIYKAKCLNHTDLVSNLSPGNVSIVVLPDVRQRSVFDPYEPSFPSSELEEMQLYINQLASLHVNVFVTNPTFKKLKIEANLQFFSEEINYYKKRAKEDLAKFLSPWAFDTDEELVFGTSVHQTSVIYFLENLEYVDYVGEVKLFDESNNLINKEAIPSSPMEILVSVKPEVHLINSDFTDCTND